MDNLSRSDRLAIVSFFATACLGFCAWAFPNMTRFFTVPGAIVTFCATIYFACPESVRFIQWVKRQKSVATMARYAPAYVPALVLLLVASLAAMMYYFTKPDHIAEGKQAFRERMEAIEKLGPLYIYYQDDPVGESDVDIQSTLSVPSGNSIDKAVIIAFTLYFNVPANVYVASIYVPAIDKAEVFKKTMTQLATKCKASFEAFLKQVHLAQSPPGQPDWLSDTTRFSGRIYLYFENFTSEDDLAQFRLLFSQNGADVTFRGPSYLAYKEGIK